ncbi:hypothetical protein J6590_106736 [Homalodisca vitripennis]|nr:hypothetical protein J6590_106736 [Homalodisca vitripennis]
MLYSMSVVPLAWISTVATLIENRQLARMCPHAAAMGSFFGGACAPGAKDIEHTRGSGVVPAKLCSVCSTHNSSADQWRSEGGVQGVRTPPEILRHGPDPPRNFKTY